MTRKKLIKKLGRYGITRNTANRMAEITRKGGHTYEQAWADFMFIIGELSEKVKDAITHAILYGEGTATVPGLNTYFPMYDPTLDFEIKPLGDPPPWQYLYAIDTKPLDPAPVIMWPKINPYLHTHTNAPGHGPVTLRVGTAGGGEE